MDVQHQRSIWLSKAVCFCQHGCHVERLRRSRRCRRAHAPTSNATSHDNHDKISSWVFFSFPYEYGAPLGGLSGLRGSAKNKFDNRRCGIDSNLFKHKLFCIGTRQSVPFFSTRSWNSKLSCFLGIGWFLFLLFRRIYYPCQEPIARSYHLPYCSSESTLYRIVLFLEAPPTGFSRVFCNSQSQESCDPLLL